MPPTSNIFFQQIVKAQNPACMFGVSPIKHFQLARGMKAKQERCSFWLENLHAEFSEELQRKTCHEKHAFHVVQLVAHVSLSCYRPSGLEGRRDEGRTND
jgi:hypothetical protein